MTTSIQQIEAWLASAAEGGIHFVTGTVAKIEAAIPVIEKDLQDAAQVVYNLAPAAITAAQDAEAVAAAVGLKIPAGVASITAGGIAALQAYMANYESGTIPESAIVAGYKAFQTVSAAPMNSAVAATTPAPAPATGSAS